MELEWTDKNGDAEAHGGNAMYPEVFEVEQASEHSFWAFMNGTPTGVYKTMTRAKERCQALQDNITAQTPDNLA